MAPVWIIAVLVGVPFLVVFTVRLAERLAGKHLNDINGDPLRERLASRYRYGKKEVRHI